MFVCCKAAEGLGECLQNCFCPADRPSPIFTMWSFVMNIVTVAIVFVHIFSGGDSGRTCTNSMIAVWNYVIIGICFLHMCFAIYLYLRFTAKIRSGDTAGKAAHTLFLYDFGVYFYIWFVVFVIVWLVLSGTWSSGELVCLNLANTAPVVSCQVIYLVAGIVVIMLSLTTNCCAPPRWTQGGVVYQQVPVQASYPTASPMYAQPPPPAPMYSSPPAANPNYTGAPAAQSRTAHVAAQVTSLFKKNQSAA